MRLGIRTKQVAGVTAVVALASAVLFGWYLATLTRILLDGSRSRADFMRNAVYQQAFTAVARGGDPATALREDSGVRGALDSAAYMEGIAYARIVDAQDNVLADPDTDLVGKTSTRKSDLDDLIFRAGPIERLRAIYTPGGRVFELSAPLTVGTDDVGSIRIGVSTALVRKALADRLYAPAITALIVIGVSVLVAMLLAQLVLRPIHVIRSGLARLGRGELDVKVDLPADAELRDLGDSFRRVTERLAADQTELAEQRAIETVVDRLEDAVALFATDGSLLFANAAMKQAIAAPVPDTRVGGPHAGPTIAQLWPAEHPYRAAVDQTLSGESIDLARPVQIPGAGDRLVLTHLVPGATGAPVGALLVSRDLAYLSQVESTIEYSRKLSKLNQLTAGIAHEIKNPLNATTIHLELLRMQVADRPEAEQHVTVIADQVRRLDEVVQAFMKFARPEELHLQPVELAGVMERLQPILEAEAGNHGVTLRLDVPADLPAVDGDPNLLEQAFLNLAINAFQAMPHGGTLRIGARAAAGRLVTIEVEDSGVGIAPENLSRIFDLYFTTKPSGSGIGLSLVFRTIQLHNGDIEVQSTVGSGTIFRIQLRQAVGMFQSVGK
ncbi:MAG TPA: ATP-binding protein [Vicinamibacterales bacterium]|nr:ATP-binding protein [Vicinamibacterales bacterium]